MINGDGFSTTEDTEDAEDGLGVLTGSVIAAALEVHSALGAGLLESAYETCLFSELLERGIAVERQLQLPVRYKGRELNAGFRIDLLVEGSLVVELKSVERILPVHRAQVLTYLKLSGRRLALILNFNVPHLREGIQRLAL